MGIRINKYAKYVINCFLKLLYFKYGKCVLCNCDIYDEKVICNKCLKNIIENKNVFYINKEGLNIKVISATYYSYSVNELIHKLKYENSFISGHILSEFMVKRLKENNINVDLITFVPLSKKAYKKRGYNQSEYLAYEVGKIINKKVKEILIKDKDTSDQIGLNNIERWNNLENSFKIKKNSIKYIKGKNILLIDDVVTTGATAFYCAKEILKNKANNIIILTAAKSSI